MACAMALPGACLAASDVTDSSGLPFALVVQQQSSDEEVFAVLEFGQPAAPAALFRSSFETDTQGVRRLEVMISAQRIRHAYAPYVYFEQAGCSGRAWLSARGAEQGMDLRAGISGADSTLYLATGHAQLVQPRSVQFGSSCRSFGNIVMALPAQAGESLAQTFPAPYRW